MPLGSIHRRPAAWLWFSASLDLRPPGAEVTDSSLKVSLRVAGDTQDAPGLPPSSSRQTAANAPCLRLSKAEVTRDSIAVDVRTRRRLPGRA